MVFKMFRKKDPVCGMREENGKGIKDKSGNWFCSENCQKEYQQKIKSHDKETKKVRSCCN